MVQLRMMLLKKDDETETQTLAMELLEAIAFVYPAWWPFDKP
jgi:hypothetical protein